MTNTLQILPGDKSRLVLILAFDGVTLSDVAGPSDVFDLASKYVANEDTQQYRVVVASLDGGSIRTSCGIRITTETIDSIDIEDVDTLLVPGGGPPTDPPVPADVVFWLRANGRRVRRVCGICTGSFLLAEAGLANGRRLTTHWSATAVLAQRYPEVHVQHEPLFVRDDSLWSSAGFSAGFDLAMALLENDLGYTTAIEVARLLVVFLKRPGDQSQQSQPLATQYGADADFGKLHAWITGHLDCNLTVEALAARVGMTPRTFARRYVERLGRTPAKTVEAFRIDAAARRLREPHASLKQIARECGFGDEQNLRRAFTRRFGHPPREQRVEPET